MADDLTKNQLKELVDKLETDNLNLQDDLEKLQNKLDAMKGERDGDPIKILGAISNTLENHGRILQGIARRTNSRIPPDMTKVATTKVDAIPGGVYRTSEGKLVNANGKLIDADGKLLTDGDNVKK